MNDPQDITAVVQQLAERIRHLETVEHSHSVLVSRQTIRVREGTITTGADEVGVPNGLDATQTISEVMLTTSAAVALADLVVDVLVDGASIFALAADRPRILVGATTGTSTTIGTPTWATTKLIVTDVVSVGTATGLVVTIKHEGAA